MFVEDSVYFPSAIGSLNLHLKEEAFLFSPPKNNLGLAHNDIEIKTTAHIFSQPYFSKIINLTNLTHQSMATR